MTNAILLEPNTLTGVTSYWAKELLKRPIYITSKGVTVAQW